MSEKSSLTRLNPASYERVPWKNGGGVMINIVSVYRAGAAGKSWNDIAWRFSRTAIVAPAPFSDFSGFDRAQVVIAGRGLVLETAGGEIDLREPFQPVLYPGEAPIASRLEDGPVEVVNLIADRELVSVSLSVLRLGAALELPPGEHVVYAAEATATLRIDGSAETLAHDHALLLRLTEPMTLHGESGAVVIGSVKRR